MSSSKILLRLPLLAIVLVSCASSGKKKLSDQDRAQGLLDLASASVTENDPTSAIQTLNQVRAIDESIPEEHYLYALAYFQKGALVEAIRSARRAIELKPTYSQAKNTLGKLLIDQGHYAEAEKFLLEAANDFTFRDAYLAKTNLGILYFKTMKTDKASLWLTDAITEAGPSACIAEFYRGQIELDHQSFERAQADLKASTRNQCSGMPETHLALGQALIRMKKYDQARLKLLEIQKLFPESEASIKAAQYLREIP